MRSTAGPCLVFLAAALSGVAAGPPMPPPDFAPISAADEAAGRTAIAQFRQIVPDTAYYEIELQIRPRRGDLRSIPGRLWVGHNDRGQVTRLVVDPGAPDERRWLIQGGPQPAAWRSDGSGAAAAAGSLEPLFPGVGITAFDLQLPYLFWPDATVLRLSRVFGSRPAYVYLFRPPAAFAAQHPEVAGVRVSFDTQYKAPLQSEILGAAGAPLKTMTVNEVKPMGEGHPAILEEVDFRNDTTRDTARIEVRAVAAGLDLLPSLFTAAALSTDVAPPDPHLLERL